MAQEELTGTQGPAVPLAVASIQVENLHGKFNYYIDLLTGSSTAGTERLNDLLTVNEDRLTLLYGRNGSGKTSVLRLLFHAVASSANRGHRTRLVRTRFSRCAVTLTDGTIVSYVRESEHPIGPCVATVARPNQEVVRWSIQPDDDLVVRSEDPQLMIWEGESDQPIYQQVHPEGEFHNALAQLNLNPIFLADSRGIRGDVLEKAESREDERRRAARLSREEDARRAADVEDAVELVRQYLTRLAIAGAQAGSSKVDSVYLNVTKVISEHGERRTHASDALPKLIEQVRRIGKRVDLLHHYGLLPELQHDRLAQQLAETAEQNGDLMQQVLGPYLEGLERRVEALEPGLEAVSTFIDALNSFLEKKTVEFHLGPDGLEIRDEETDRTLRPGELSSGEKQIVLLFSDVVALQNETRLFIIDEPELSLNPEWQRHLMPQLLAVTAQSRMQLVAATHSIEILAQYRSRIHSLDG